jgi:hypothetical protein
MNVYCNTVTLHKEMNLTVHSVQNISPDARLLSPGKRQLMFLYTGKR